MDPSQYFDTDRLPTGETPKAVPTETKPVRAEGVNGVSSTHGPQSLVPHVDPKQYSQYVDTGIGIAYMRQDALPRITREQAALDENKQGRLNPGPEISEHCPNVMPPLSAEHQEELRKRLGQLPEKPGTELTPRIIDLLSPNNPDALYLPQVPKPTTPTGFQKLSSLLKLFR